MSKYKSLFWNNHTKRLRRLQRIYDWFITHCSIRSIPLQGKIQRYDSKHSQGMWGPETLGLGVILNNYLSKSSVPSAPKSVLNWEVLKLKFVSEKSKTSKKMSETLSLVPTPNKSAKPLCSVNKFIHSITANFILRFDCIL